MEKIMKKVTPQNILFIGIKLSIQSLFLLIFFSPVLVISDLYVYALERNVVNWSISGLPLEMLCLSGPVMVLLWYSIPYILGATILAFLIYYSQNELIKRLMSVISGACVGIIGNYFYYNSLITVHLGSWVLVGLLEIWIIVNFIWLGNQVNRELYLGSRQ